MKRWIGFFILLLLLSSCAGTNQDNAVDTKLGLTKQDDMNEAEQTANELRKQQLAEQKRNLERQITDPVVQ